MLIQLVNVFMRRKILMSVLMLWCLFLVAAEVRAEKTTVAMYLKIPDDVVGEQLGILKDINDRLNNNMEAFFSRGDTVEFHRIRNKKFVDVAYARELDVYEESLEEWLEKKESIDAYVSEYEVDYILVGKFERVYGDKFGLHWNIVQTNLITSLNYDAKQKYRIENDLIVEEYKEEPREIVADIRDELLSYIDTYYSTLTSTNVVFCSCFNLKKSSNSDIELEFLRNRLPGQLAILLGKKMKNVTFKEPSILGPDSSCDTLNINNLKKRATRIITPDYYISGNIYGYLQQNKIKIEMGIAKTRNKNNISPYSLESTKRKRDAELFPEELAKSIQDKWEDIEKKYTQ